MRCFTLGEELRRHGASVHFICRQLPGNYIDWLIAHGMVVHQLKLLSTPREQTDCSSGYADWLGVSLEYEIQQVKDVLASTRKAAWLVVDHYALDARWEREMRPLAEKILCIDDLANRPHECDLLLDQNFSDDPDRRYAGLVPATCQTLIGPDFSLLRPEFAYWRSKIEPREGRVGRIFLFFGGSDAANVTAKVLRALDVSKCLGPDVTVDVVTGNANPHNDEIQAVVRQMHGVRYFQQVDNMAELMAKADLAIGATGAATWERSALGLPTLAVSVADNQRRIGYYADKIGILRWIGDAEDISIDEWVCQIDRLCNSPDILCRQSLAGLAQIDPFGARRVAENMF